MLPRFLAPALVAGLALASTAALADSDPSCKLIDRAISANEDFAETAMAGDSADITSNFEAVKEGYDNVKSFLSEQDSSAIAGLIATIEKEITGSEPKNAAVPAIDIYRILITAFEKRLPTTLDVAMLDYTGFRLKALVSFPSPDWPGIVDTAKVSADNVASVVKRLKAMKDGALADLTRHHQRSITEASKAANAAWLNDAAQIQLDLVDLLERRVKNDDSAACK